MTRNPDTISSQSNSRRSSPAAPAHRRAFTLAELLVVCGLVAMLLSLLLPVISKARSAAQATRCLSNLREMGNAWTMYTAGNRGHLMGRTWFIMTAPDFAWHAYWPGIVENYGVRGESLTCPVAAEPIPDAASGGYGTAIYSWSGRYAGIINAIKLTPTQYRDGSYGMNRYLTAGNGFGEDGMANKITAVRNTCEVPVFMDCAWVDTQPDNGSATNPTDPPPNLLGDQIGVGSPGHWNFLLARHGRGVNVVFADGSARWVRLEDTYMMSWKARWARYRIPLPSH